MHYSFKVNKIISHFTSVEKNVFLVFYYYFILVFPKLLSIWASRIQSNLTGSSRRRRNHVFLIFFPTWRGLAVAIERRLVHGLGMEEGMPPGGHHGFYPRLPLAFLFHLFRKNSAWAVLWCYGFVVYVLSVAGVLSLYSRVTPCLSPDPKIFPIFWDYTPPFYWSQ